MQITQVFKSRVSVFIKFPIFFILARLAFLTLVKIAAIFPRPPSSSPASRKLCGTLISVRAFQNSLNPTGLGTVTLALNKSTMFEAGSTIRLRIKTFPF